MTAIVAVADRQKVWMASDSAVTSVGHVTGANCAKITRVGPFLIGAAGCVRYCNLMLHSLNPARPPAGANLERYVALIFTEQARSILRDSGALMVGQSGEIAEGMMLLAFEGRIFLVSSNFGVAEYREGFAAIGSGRDLALGALAVTKRRAPEARMRAALEASSLYSAGVRPPYVMLSVDRPQAREPDESGTTMAEAA